ncbi:MAG TPA: hypothetical protein VEI74_07460 [Candidatus Methylomirabilis sp.]|nr:hypothetical protein [Candidatus Methylomirabilis sp.]
MDTAEEKNRDNARRRKADRYRGAERRSGHAVRVPPWEEQRAQYLTRLRFWALGPADFNLAGALHTSASVRARVDQVMYRGKLERARGGILPVSQAAPA